MAGGRERQVGTPAGTGGGAPSGFEAPECDQMDAFDAPETFISRFAVCLRRNWILRSTIKFDECLCFDSGTVHESSKVCSAIKHNP